MSEVRKIGEFLADILKPDADREDDAIPVKIVVTHLIRGNKLGDEIRSIQIPANRSEDWPHATATKIYEQASKEAIALGTELQRYTVQVFFASEKGTEDRPRQRHVMTATGDRKSLDDLTTEGPSPEGQIAQLQRHVEAATQLALKHTANTIEDYRIEIRALRDENASLRAERIRDFQAMEEVHSLQHTRAAEMRREDLKTSVIQSSIEKVQALLPMAVGHLAAKGMVPESVAQTLLIKQFVDCLTPSDWQALATVLPAEKIALLIHLGQSVSRMKPDPTPATAPNGGQPGNSWGHS